MKLIRWLFSNIILIIFVLAITYAYVYWDDLTGEDTPAGKAIAYLSVEYDEVREFLDAYDFGDGEADLVTAVEPEPEVEREREITETASVPQAMPAPRAQSARPSPQPSALQPQPVPPQAMMQPPAQSSRPASPAARTPQRPPPAGRQQLPPTAMVPQRPVMPQQAPARPPAEPAATRAAPAPAAPTAQADAPEVDVRQLWISAREEYHRGNIQQSIANYQQVIAHSSDNYDAYGELGNVYLSRGRYRDAADAYFQAAAILVDQGQIGRAGTLLPMLERLDRAKAQELNQLMTAQRG